MVVLFALGALCQPEIPTTANTTTPLTTINENSNALSTIDTTEDELTNSEVGPELSSVDIEAQNRDAERMARITQIQDALESFKTVYAAYPEKLEQLVSEFLTTIPKNLDESDFSYTPIGALPAQFYDLCYELEVGVGTITAGYHCATPDGIANP